MAPMSKLTVIAAIALLCLAGCDVPPPAQSPADEPPAPEPEVTEPEVAEPEAAEPEVAEPEAAPTEDPSPMLPPCEEHKKKKKCEISQGCAWDDGKKACVQHQEGL